MYALIAEDRSDVDVLKTLIRRIANDNSVPIKAKGYSGCGEMLRKGASQLEAFAGSSDAARFLVCYDSDREDPNVRKRRIVDEVINPSGVNGIFCALVPVQEIESWILADLKAVTHVIPSWRPNENYVSPENVNDPKEELRRLSHGTNRKPRFSNAAHNPAIARHLDLDIVRARCPSFVPLYRFVTVGESNI